MANTQTEQLKDQASIDSGQRLARSPSIADAGTELKNISGQISSGSQIPGMQAQGEDKLKQLYDFDRSIEAGGESPVASSAQALYGKDFFSSPAPYYQSASRSLGDQASGVKDLFSTISAFKSMEGSALSSAMSTIFSFLNIQEQRKKDEDDRKYKSGQTSLEIVKMTGGSWTDPISGVTHNIPAPASLTGRSTSDILGLGAGAGQTDTTKTPQYSPAKAGITEVGVDGQTYTSDAKGQWKIAGGETFESGITRESVINAMINTTDSNELKRLETILDALQEEKDKKLSKDERMFTNLERGINDMEVAFGRGDSAKVGTGEDLSTGPSIWSKIGRGARRVGRGFGIPSDLIEDANIYEAKRDLLLPLVTQVFGSGTPQEAEAKRFIESAPNFNSTDAEAKEWFAGFRKILGLDTPGMGQSGGQSSSYTVGGYQVEEL